MTSAARSGIEAAVPALAAGAGAQVPTPVGSELQVNAYTSGSRRIASVAMDADGDFVVAWEDSTPDPSGGVAARRFTASGTAQLLDLAVNTHVTAVPSITAHLQGLS